METGWIKIHRKLRKKSYYNKSHYVHLWVELLLLASHEGSEFIWNGVTQKLIPGQFVTGRKQLSESTGIPETSVERLLTFYEKDAQIRQQKNNKFRLITILKWNDYQQSGQQTDNKRTSNGHIQECKNVKNDKKETHMEFLRNIPEADMKAIIERFDVTPRMVMSKAEDLENYCKRKGRTYKDYKALLLNAIKKDFKVRIKEIPREEDRPLTPEEKANQERAKAEISRVLGLDKLTESKRI